MPRETDARMVVDQLLKDAGWDIFDKSQVSTEEPAADGRADYLLKNSLTPPLCVIETKRFSTDPYSAKQQALPYARGLGAPFIILSNGREHYFWDYGDGDARDILGLPSRADLEVRANLKLHRQGAIQDALIATHKAIIPAAVGVDIGCGMVAARLSITAIHKLTNRRKAAPLLDC